MASMGLVVAAFAGLASGSPAAAATPLTAPATQTVAPATQTVVPATQMVAAATHPPDIPGNAHLVGPLNHSTTLQVSVILRSQDPAGLQQLASAVSSAGSVNYAHFLQPGEVQAHFGATPSVITAVQAWLTGKGLAVGAGSGDGLEVTASGSALAVEAAFATPISHYSLATGRQVYANVKAPMVPASIQPDVVAVLGLDDLAQANSSIAKPTAARPVPASRSAASETVAGAANPCAAATATGGATADLLASFYDFDSLYREGKLGEGMTIGLFELANYSDSDITTFEQCYGIGRSVQRVLVDGGTTLADSGSATDEATLDIEDATSLAPKANILVYVANDGLGNTGAGFQAVYDTYAAMLQQNRAQVISTSYGFCEADLLAGGINFATVEAPLFQAMAVQGQSIVAASGDEGSEDCVADVASHGVNKGNSVDPYALAVDDPASQPFVTGVGGTMIDTGGHQTAWNETAVSHDGTGYTAPFDGVAGRPDHYPGNLAGTGGVSSNWQMPPWQVGFDNSGNSGGTSCGAPASEDGVIDCREVPDVAALAVGYVVYEKADAETGWTVFGGTSAAAPLWAAMLALVDEGTAQGRLGLVTPALYQTDRADPAAFTDITAGDNNYLSSTSSVPVSAPGNDSCTYNGSPSDQPCYEATPGYDMATGLGTPEAGVLATALDDLQIGITTISLPSGTVGVPFSATLTAVGGATPYTWSLAGSALPEGLALDPATGVIAGTPDLAGTSAVTIEVSGTGAATPSSGTGNVAPPSASLSLTIVIDKAPALPGGYWAVAADGGIFSFGGLEFYGSMGGHPLNRPIVGMAPTPDGLGYWEVGSDGGVFAFGDAPYRGSTGSMILHRPVVAMVATTDGQGYWLVASDGGIFAFGDAGFYGSMGGSDLNVAIVGMAPTSDGKGYWEVAADGRVFAFGDATYQGSMAGHVLTSPIVGMADDTATGGYWLVAGDGGVFSFGAPFYGSTGAINLNSPIVAMAASAGSLGYRFVAGDGGIFDFGNAAFDGSMGGQHLNQPVVGFASVN